MTSTAVAEARERLTVKRQEMAAIFAKHPDHKFPPEVRDDITARNAELSDLQDAFEAAREADETFTKNREALRSLTEPATQMVHPGGEKAGLEVREITSLGQQFTETAAYKAGRGDATPRFRVELSEVSVKTLMTTTDGSGFAPYPALTSRVVLSAQRRPVVADVIPTDDTTANAILYMEETTFTNAAAPVAEGGTKQESALALTRRTQPVEVVATWLPVTRQQVDDVPQVRALIDNRLTFMLKLAEESQLLTGDGNSPNLQGFLTKSGVQTQAQGSDPSESAIMKAMTKVRFTGYADPSAVILHPNDWQDMRLHQASTGFYIWGAPSDAGVERIWGLPVIVTPAITENTGLVGDFALYSHISRRMGVEIAVSDSHDTYFIKNQLAIRVEERLSLEIYRAAAFCKVTGLAA